MEQSHIETGITTGGRSLRSRYVNADGSEQLERDIILVPVGDPEQGVGYVFDLQKLSGRKLHTWCFHGCESDDLAINVDMQEKTVRWIDRTLPPHRVGQASDKLHAVWTITRQSREIPHQFNGGGVIKTVACEPHVLGDRYDPKRPPVRVRATLLNQSGAMVMQGSPFSQAYSYCFPFLWVQKPAQGESVFPAVYDWYRGDIPVVRQFEKLPGLESVYQIVTSTGQTDVITYSKNSISVVSRDSQGLRWGKLVHGRELKADDLTLSTEVCQYQATVADIDYVTRRLKLDLPFPADTYALIGNSGRSSYLFLRGSGVERRFDDDLIMHQSTISRVQVKGAESISVETELDLFQVNAGNRKLAGLTQTTEDHRWHFRNGQVIRRPAEGRLSPEVFADADGDGATKLRTYELGVGDPVTLPADVEIRRAKSGWQIKTNVPVTLTTSAGQRRLQPGGDWQD